MYTMTRKGGERDKTRKGARYIPPNKTPQPEQNSTKNTPFFLLLTQVHAHSHVGALRACRREFADEAFGVGREGANLHFVFTKHGPVDAHSHRKTRERVHFRELGVDASKRQALAPRAGDKLVVPSTRKRKTKKKIKIK